MPRDHLPMVICAVCRHALDMLTTEDGGHYVHTSQDPDDHEPVPVTPDADWRGRCDFCNEDDPMWMIPARDFSLPEAFGPLSPGSLGNWSACETCKRLIESDQWNRLVTRAIESVARTHHVPPGALDPAPLRQLYRLLRKNITGAPQALPTPKENE